MEYVNVGTGETMETLLSGQLPEHLPRLRRLRLHTGFLMITQPFERLFTLCTYLQELDLQTSFLSRAMCEALARLPHLHTFKYSYGARDFVVEMTWLVEQWAQAGESCPLKTLELAGFYFPSWGMHPLIVSMGYVRPSSSQSGRKSGRFNGSQQTKHCADIGRLWSCYAGLWLR